MIGLLFNVVQGKIEVFRVDELMDNIPDSRQVSGNGMYVCPCCNNFTISEPAEFEICPICCWEDDGQDDPHADIQNGGPNGDYSLTEARVNYQKYLVQYRPEDERFGIEAQDDILGMKKDLIDIYNKLENEKDKNKLYILQENIKKMLETLLYSRLAYYEHGSCEEVYDLSCEGIETLSDSINELKSKIFKNFI